MGVAGIRRFDHREGSWGKRSEGRPLRGVREGGPGIYLQGPEDASATERSLILQLCATAGQRGRSAFSLEWRPQGVECTVPGSFLIRTYIAGFGGTRLVEGWPSEKWRSVRVLRRVDVAILRRVREQRRESITDRGRVI